MWIKEKIFWNDLWGKNVIRIYLYFHQLIIVNQKSINHCFFDKNQLIIVFYKQIN